MSNLTSAVPAATTIDTTSPATVGAELYRKALDGLTDAQLYLSQSMCDLTAAKLAALDDDQFDLAATYRQSYDADRARYMTINKVALELQALLIKAQKGTVDHV